MRQKRFSSRILEILLRRPASILHPTMAQHAQPQGECLVCYEELSADNYVEYRVGPDAPWLPAKFCETCLQTLLDTKFEAYISGVASSTCEAELRRYMAKGPPVYVEDPTGLPVQEGENGCSVNINKQVFLFRFVCLFDLITYYYRH